MEETILFLKQKENDRNTQLHVLEKIFDEQNISIQKKITFQKPSILLIFMPFVALAVVFQLLGLAPALLVSALIFEMVNGFHDVSNVVAPLVRSNTLSYRPAVIWSTLCTALPVLMIGIASAKIAHAIGSNLFVAGTLSQIIMFSGVSAAFGWGLITWRYGLPSSSSHALMGGLAGASMTSSFVGGLPVFDNLLTTGWLVLIASMVFVPVIAGFCAYIITKIIPFLERKIAQNISQENIFVTNPYLTEQSEYPKVWKKYFNVVKYDILELCGAFKKLKKWPMLLASGALSFAHSRNDGQKAMPMVAGVIYGDPTKISVLVQLLCYSAITLGTLMGGSLIMKKLNSIGHNHKPSGGVVSMGVTSGVVGLATEIGIGVSTTQTTASSIMGTSYARTPEIVQMMTTWIITPIASGVIAGIIVLITRT